MAFDQPVALANLSDSGVVLTGNQVEEQLQRTHRSADLQSAERTEWLYRFALRAMVEGRASGTVISDLLQTACNWARCPHALLLRRLAAEVVEVAATAARMGADTAGYVGQHIALPEAVVKPLFEPPSASFSSSSSGFVCDGVEMRVLGAINVAPLSGESLALVLLNLTSEPPEEVQSLQPTLELLAEGVAAMVELQKTHAQRKLTDQAVLAMGSVKTLEEYYAQAALPEVYGIPARVVDSLKHRIGHSSLDIGVVAEDINLSKRTLQRRLQQQNISFAELRDQVRFHYSLDFLVKQHLSIDSISGTLDFSDRTSFTNAFKRWTGLSPSTFRKLFRDYV